MKRTLYLPSFAKPAPTDFFPDGVPYRRGKDREEKPPCRYKGPILLSKSQMPGNPGAARHRNECRNCGGIHPEHKGGH